MRTYIVKVSELTLGDSVFVPGPNHVGSADADRHCHYEATVTGLTRQHSDATEIRLTYGQRGSYGVSMAPTEEIRRLPRTERYCRSHDIFDCPFNH